jgi:hypothetical protein
LEITNGIHRFYALIFFFVQALRQWSKFGKQRSDETLITAKNYSNEAMKRFTLAKKL